MVNQADDNGKIIRFVPLDHGQKVTGFTGARLYYPPRSGDGYGDYVTGVESDSAWDFTIPVGVLSAGRVGCNLAFIDGDGETYSRNVVFLVEPAVSGVFDPEDGQQTRLDKIIGTVQNVADTDIGTINETADSAVERVNKTASDAVESIGKAEESINKSVTDARGSAEAAANSANQASSSASAAQTSERNASNSATQASQSATAAKQSEDNAAESARNAASSERNAASSAEQAASIVASVSGSVTQAENAARSASYSATAAGGSASAAGGSAQAAADSASKAGESATVARASETNAASSASAAASSETNAAASAAAAQNVVEGFGLEVGTTTTGDPGTDAAVEIQKTGTKYTANFTIPRGDKGEQASVTHDATLTGDGTANNPLGAAMGSAVNQTYVFADGAFDLNNLTDFGIFALNNDQYTVANTPVTAFRGCVFVTNNGYPSSNKSSLCQLAVCRNWSGGVEIYTRGLKSGSWTAWARMASMADIPKVSTLTSRIATLEAESNEFAVMQTRLQALEARIKSLETNQ